MNFLGAINRIFVSSAIIRGDTDLVTTFNDIAHNASLNVGIVAVQNELVRLIADRLIPKERNTSGVITLATNTRTYDLATDFTRFYGTPHFYNVTRNVQIYEYNGGLERLQIEVFNFATQYGQPNWWYWEPGNTTSKQVGLFMVPSSAEAGESWTYDYEASVMVTASSDDLSTTMRKRLPSWRCVPAGSSTCLRMSRTSLTFRTSLTGTGVTAVQGLPFTNS